MLLRLGEGCHFPKFLHFLSSMDSWKTSVVDDKLNFISAFTFLPYLLCLLTVSMEKVNAF